MNGHVVLTEEGREEMDQAAIRLNNNICFFQKHPFKIELNNPGVALYLGKR